MFHSCRQYISRRGTGTASTHYRQRAGFNPFINYLLPPDLLRRQTALQTQQRHKQQRCIAAMAVPAVAWDSSTRWQGSLVEASEAPVELKPILAVRAALVQSAVDTHGPLKGPVVGRAGGMVD
jgi:hypothetical protein